MNWNIEVFYINCEKKKKKTEIESFQQTQVQKIKEMKDIETILFDVVRNQ